MKKLLLLLLFVVLVVNLFSQSNLISPKFKFDSTHQIIGLCHFSDKKMTNQKFTFLINDINNLQKIQQEVTVGKEAMPGSRNPSLNICIVKSKRIIDSYSFIPEDEKITFVNRLDSIGGTFQFNIQEMLRYANKIQLNYIAKEQKFKSKSELEKFLKMNEGNPNFLCYDNVTSSYEGTFQILMRGSANFTTPDGFKIIEDEFKKMLVPKDDYMMAYSPSFKDPSLLTYTIWTSKENYDKFSMPGIPKGKWKRNEITLLTYWLK
jgi:hypothetical protein